MSCLGQFLESLQSSASRVCVEGTGFCHTYAHLLEQLEHWQVRFDRLNVAPGCVIGIRSDYSLATVAALFAICARGAVAALIPRNGVEATYLVNAHASALLESIGAENFRWQPQPYSTAHPLLDDLRAMGHGGIVVFTSGSTGQPKAALHSVERFLHKFLRPGRRLRTLAFMLFDHVAGLDTLCYTFANGGTLVVPPRRDPQAIAEIIERHKVEVLPTSPSFLRLLCAREQHARFDLTSVKIITYGSELMDASTLAWVNARFPQARIVQKYGTTETGSPSSRSRGNDSLWLRITSDDVETKVVDGVLWLRSEGTLLGYLNAPSPINEQGWYCTGDLVDVEGKWIRFRGRVADIINVGGEKVAPAEVEQTILELDFVRAAMVAAAPHPLMGEIVSARVAVMSIDLDPKEAARRIQSHCRRHLAPHKVPLKIDIIAGDLGNDRHKLRRRPDC